jgi:membrane protein DedA with SNARE-associated domain
VLPLIVAALGVAALAWLWRRLSNLLRAAAILAIVAVALYGFGAFELPSFEHTLLSVGEALGPYTYLLVGTLAFLETGAGVGLIAPGEVAVVVGGITAGQGKTNLALLIGIVWACAFAGDAVSFTLGRRLGREWIARHGRRMKLSAERFEQVEGFFARHGAKTVIVGRFIGFVRSLAPFVAGASSMAARRFLPAALVAAGLWSATFAVLGYFSWRSLSDAVKLARNGSIALVVLVVLVVGGALLHRRLRGD